MPAILSVQPWIIEEFAGAELGDTRRTERLLQIAQNLAQNPHGSIPQAFNGKPHAMKAAYRFFDNDAISEEEILAPHILTTTQRCQSMPLVLVPQDTTLLDFSHHPETKNLGYLKNRHVTGLVVHTTLAMTPEKVPLGHLCQQVWTRDLEDLGKKYQRKELPIEQKESQKWLFSVEKTNEAKACCPNTKFVNIGDREADVYDLFLLERSEGVELLVRACRDRKVEEEGKYLWRSMSSRKEQAEVTVKVPRTAKLPEREARASLRYGEITLKPPKHRTAEGLPSIKLYAVLLQEKKPPKDVNEPLEWLLLTTVPVYTMEEAIEKTEWYGCRWGIEIYHKILKSGCAVEELQLQDGENIKRCFAIYAVIAWRIMYGTMMARECPQLPCDCFLEEYEWKALYCTVHNVSEPPKETPTLEETILWLGKLGGFIGRKSDGKPGVTVIWKGLSRLNDLSTMYAILRPSR